MSDLSLPKTADTEKYSYENHDKDKIAVYTLTKLEGGSNKLEQALKQDSITSHSCVFSAENFVNKPLKDVLKHHLNVAGQEKLDPTIFIAAHSENFDKDGVLLVNANFDLKGSVDKCRVKTSLALLEAVNLQIGNVDWWEVDREDPIEPAPRLGENDDQAPVLVIFGAYGIKAGANMTKIRDLLEPGWHEKKANAWRCESVGSYTSGSDPLKEVIKYHPWHCLQKPHMSRHWCICVDSLNPSEDGVLLLHIDWDGDTKREPTKLLEVGPQSQIQTERVGVNNALNVLAAK